MQNEIRNLKRVAVPSIRGYWYQTEHTVRAWLEATDDHLLFAEGNEDIDQLLKDGSSWKACEEQIKFRSTPIRQGDEAISETVCHYLEAFVYHHKKNQSFRGVLRTNAEILGSPKTEIGNWILGKATNQRRLIGELKALVSTNKAAREALKFIVTNKLVKIFVSSVEWAPRSGSLKEIEQVVSSLIKKRAPSVPREAAINALRIFMLQRLTSDDVNQRTLRPIDADLVLNNCALDALPQTEHALSAESSVALWSRLGPPSIAVAIFVGDKKSFESAVNRGNRHGRISGEIRTTTELLSKLAKRLSFVAYVSIRRQKGPKGMQVCMKDVVRQSAIRHTPSDVVILHSAPAGVDAWVAKRWPTPTRIARDVAGTRQLELAAAIGEEIAKEENCALLQKKLGTKLRWIHIIDDGNYFTAAHPIGGS